MCMYVDTRHTRNWTHEVVDLGLAIGVCWGRSCWCSIKQVLWLSQYWSHSEHLPSELLVHFQLHVQTIRPIHSRTLVHHHHLGRLCSFHLVLMGMWHHASWCRQWKLWWFVSKCWIVCFLSVHLETGQYWFADIFSFYPKLFLTVTRSL